MTTLPFAAMAMMATRLKVAWATMFMPRRPVRYETAARITPKVARPGQLYPLAVGQAEEQPVDDHGQDDSGDTGAADRPQLREQRGPGAFSSRPRKKSSSMAGARSTVAMAMNDEPGAVRRHGELLRGPLKFLMSCWNGAYMMATRIWPPSRGDPHEIDDTEADAEGRAAKNGTSPWVRLASHGAPMKPIHRPSSVDTTYHSGGTAAEAMAVISAAVFPAMPPAM